MNFIPYGIYCEKSRIPPFMKASHFSDKQYEGVQLRKGKDDSIVLITHSKRTAPLEWRVVYGFSEVYFKTFKDAVEFCNSRNMTLLKESENSQDV